MLRWPEGVWNEAPYVSTATIHERRQVSQYGFTTQKNQRPRMSTERDCASDANDTDHSYRRRSRRSLVVLLVRRRPPLLISSARCKFNHVKPHPAKWCRFTLNIYFARD